MPDGCSDGPRHEARAPIAFKTGTSYGFRDAWALGFSRDYTVGIWVGRPDGSTRPGRFARNEAAPLLMNVFDLLPPDAGPRRHRRRPTSSSRTPTPSCRARCRLSRRHARAHSAVGPKLAIAFPPDGAIVSMPEGRGDDDTLALRAEGGRGKLFWLVDGVPLSSAAVGEAGQRIFWHPEGEGFVRISVVDQAARKRAPTSASSSRINLCVLIDSG